MGELLFSILAAVAKDLWLVAEKSALKYCILQGLWSGLAQVGVLA